jgi:diguanylate cyclase (GGDEF)-like protein
MARRFTIPKWARSSLNRQILAATAVMLVPVFVIGLAGSLLFDSSVRGFGALAVPVSRATATVTHIEAANQRAQAVADAAYEYHAPDKIAAFAAARADVARGFDELLGMTRGSEHRVAIDAERSWRAALDVYDHAMAGKPFMANPTVPYLLVSFFDKAFHSLDHLNHLIDTYTRSITSGAQAARAAWHRQTLELLGVVLVTVLAALALSRWLARAIADPLRQLRVAAVEVGRGNLSHRVVVDANNELGEVAEAFNAMSRSLARSRERLSHQAFHDSLTGLPNRALLADRTDHAFDRARRSGRVLAVVLLDLDDFKAVNDSDGHAAGDDVLVSVAGALRRAVRPGDTVARLGGDEFAVLLEDLEHDAEAELAARRLLDAVHGVVRDGLMLKASIGIAASRGDETYDELLRDADVAMYRAKAGGKDRVVTFETSMVDELMRRKTLESDLAQALPNGELRVVYQPLVSLATGSVHGFEALVRWQHPERGLVGPAEFVPVAERTGLIRPIGLWVLEQACRQHRVLRDHTGGRERLSMSVNLSLEQLRDPELCDHVARIIRQVDVDPSEITLEVTESVIMDDVETAVNQLRSLRDVGVNLAIDDFGTGYSSLAYLRRLPVHAIKIDKSFVDGLAHGTEESRLVRAIIELGHTIGVATVAEGVESAEQRDELVAYACDLGQGFLWARPAPPEALLALLHAADDGPIARPTPLPVRRHA